MSEVNESTERNWDFSADLDGEVWRTNRYNSGAAAVGTAEKGGDWRFQVAEFAKGAAEMSVEFGKGVRDVMKQTVLREDSVIMRKCKGPCAKVLKRLRFLNEYLPEDRDPVHVWSVIACVWVIALAALIVNTNQTTTPLVKKMSIRPPSATRIMLPDGRRFAYQEQGVPADQARYSMILPHSFLSSRLAGIPGLKTSLLQEFGIRLVTYDLPGFGESDPQPGRNLESSAMDMLHLSYAVNITEQFWVVGYSDGSKHAWAALRYIPDRIAGAIMVAPMVNPYEARLTKEEKRKMWAKWTTKKRMLYHLARKFPKLLGYYYRRTFLSGNHGKIDTWLSFSPGKRDKDLIEDQVFEEFWQRNIEEAVRQGNVKPFVEEAVLQVSNWGFSIADLKANNIARSRGIIGWLKSMYTPAKQRMSGYLGPIHIWQGAEDRVVPPAMSDFVYRVLPDVMLHKLPYEGHFTYFYFCDECHRQMLTVVFGNPEGPIAPEVDVASVEDDEVNANVDSTIEDDEENANVDSTIEDDKENRDIDSTTDEVNITSLAS